MDLTPTAQAVPVVAAMLPWWHYLIAALFGWALPAAIVKNPAIVTTAAEGVKKLAPAAEIGATLAGLPALAGGIEAANKIATAVTQTTDPNQLATLAVMHGQALVAASDPSAPAPVVP